MAKEKLLLADNDPEYLAMIRKILTNEGYKVYTARNPSEALSILAEYRIDLAVLDLRLIDNADRFDTSGLEVAKQISPSIPKIIISDYENIEAVTEALAIDVDGLPAAVDFVDKNKGAERLLIAIEKGLRLIENLQKSVDRLSDKLDGYFDDARYEAKWMFWLSLIVSSFGIGIIFIAGILGAFRAIPSSVATATATLITQGIAVLIFRRSDSAAVRRDLYHQELLRIRQFEILFNACSMLKIRQQYRARKEIIDAAIVYWFKANGSESIPSLIGMEEAHAAESSDSVGE